MLQLDVTSAGVSVALSVLTLRGGAAAAAGATTPAAVDPRDAFGNHVHASTAGAYTSPLFKLNVSAFCGIRGAFRVI